MIFIIVELLVCALLTYCWILGSHIYIELSRSYAASSYPGDLTLSQELTYQFFFPVSLLLVLILMIVVLKLIFKKYLPSKKIYINIIPLICMIYILIDLYIFLFIK